MMAIESLYMYALAQGSDTPTEELDNQPSSEVVAMESFLVPASSEHDEVECTPRHIDQSEGHELTSFLSDDTKRQSGIQPVTIAYDRLLSAHTNIADLAEPNYTTNNQILNNAKSDSHHASRQATALNMAPPTAQRPRRVKYKESTINPVLHEQDEQDEQVQPDQLASDSRPLPHMIISTPPSASPATTTTLGRKDITLPEQGSKPAKTAEAQKAPKSDSSSSQPSDQQSSSPNTDSTVDMRDRNHRRHKQAPQVPTEENQELLFHGRRAGNLSNATTSTKRYGSSNGAPTIKADGETDRPALAAKSTNQTTSNNPGKPDAMSKPHSSTTGQTSWRPKPVKSHPIHESEQKPPANNWDTGHPPLPNNVRLNGGSPSKPHNYNGRVRTDRRNGRKPRESPWIKDSLISKGDPKRHQARWSSPSRESSSPDSGRASSGWGTRRKRENDGAALGDWSGGLAPAAIDWDSRAPFKDHQTEVRIDNWLATVSSTLAHVAQVSFTDGAKAFSFSTTSSGERELIPQEMGDVAPRYWAPTHMEGNIIAVFWNNHISIESSLKMLDDGDLDHVKPWWQRYVDAKSCMLQEYKQPWIAGNDPDETAEERLAREFDTGGMTASVNRKAAERAKRDAERKRKLARVAKAYKASGVHAPSVASATPNGIKPGLNLFLRSATKADMIPLRDIYNRYIDNTFAVPETSRRTESDMLNRLQAARDVKLPFIVACQRGEVVKARNKKHNGGEDMVMSDRVVGFAYATDWIDEEDSIYRTTVQMEVFVDMDHYMKKIGSCLADKLMFLLEPCFLERGGYETVGDELDGIGASKVVSNVMIRYSYEAQNAEKLAWVSGWLDRRLGFQKVADLQGVAQKFDKK